MRVPRRVGKSQLKFLGDPLSNLYPLRTQRRQCSAGSAKLQHQRLGKCRFQSLSAASHRAQPARALQAKRNRRRRLQQCPPKHDGLSMFVGKPQKRLLQASQIGNQNGLRLFQQQYQAGIGDVLTSGSPVHESCRRGIDGAYVLGQGLNHRNRGRAGAQRFLRELRDIELRRLGGLADGGCRGLGHDPQLRLRAGERNLKIKHRLQHRSVGKNLGHGAAGRQAVDEPRRHLFLLGWGAQANHLTAVPGGGPPP